MTVRRRIEAARVNGVAIIGRHLGATLALSGVQSQTLVLSKTAMTLSERQTELQELKRRLDTLRVHL